MSGILLGASSADRYSIAAAGDGFIATSFDRKLASAGTIFAASGAEYAFLLPLKAGELVSSCSMINAGAGASLTLFKYGLYTKAGVLVAQTADIKASVIVDTMVTGSFTAAYTVPVSDVYYAAAVVVHGGTAPTFLSSAGITADASLPNGSNPRPTIRQTGLSDLASPLTLTTASTINYWIAVA